jgi:hypothetical protein
VLIYLGKNEPTKDVLMTRSADRIPVESAYLEALGRAVYNFAYLEWGVIWLCETLQPGFLRKAAKLTAGQIKDEFIRMSADFRSDSGFEDLKYLSEMFAELVHDRNRLVHGNPFSAPSGEQRLGYRGKHGDADWTIDLIYEFADRTANASLRASRLLHGGRLERYHSQNGSSSQTHS